MATTRTLVTFDVEAYARILQASVDRAEMIQVENGGDSVLASFDRGMVAALRLVLTDLANMTDPDSTIAAAVVR